MGNDQATLLHKDLNRLQMSKYLQISAQHNKKLYQKSIKPQKQFQSIIKSIHVRSTYLKYQWAVQLSQELTKNPQKLYQQYCESFKLSLMKNRHLKYFQPKSISFNFFNSLQNTSNALLMKNFTKKSLENLFQEVKCYFMVLNWFRDLPLNNPIQYHKATLAYHQSSKQNINFQKTSQFVPLKKDHASEIDCQRQKIYRILLKLTEIYFDNHYFERQLNSGTNQAQSQKINPIKRFSPKQANLIKLIAGQSNFRKRQIFIGLLLDLLQKKYQNEMQKNQQSQVQQNKIIGLVQILGLKKVYCVLKVLTEVGEIQQIQQVSMTFNFILQKILIPNQKQKQDCQNLRTNQSPEKKSKSKSNNKHKPHLIR